jgi:hypothetical protein
MFFGETPPHVSAGLVFKALAGLVFEAAGSAFL